MYAFCECVVCFVVCCFLFLFVLKFSCCVRVCGCVVISWVLCGGVLLCFVLLLCLIKVSGLRIYVCDCVVVSCWFCVVLRCCCMFLYL